MARQQTTDFGDYDGLRTRGRWGPAEGARVLADWRQSGESMSSFAQRHGLPLHRLRYWLERLGPSQAPLSTPSMRLVPAVMRPGPLLSLDAAAASVAVCVICAGVRVEIADPNATDPQWVASLVSGLRGARA